MMQKFNTLVAAGLASAAFANGCGESSDVVTRNCDSQALARTLIQRMLDGKKFKADVLVAKKPGDHTALWAGSGGEFITDPLVRRCDSKTVEYIGTLIPEDALRRNPLALHHMSAEGTSTTVYQGADPSDDPNMTYGSQGATIEQKTLHFDTSRLHSSDSVGFTDGYAVFGL